MITVLSSFLAADCTSDDAGVVVRNPGRALVSLSEERERLRALGGPFILLPELVAVLTLLSDQHGPFDYRLSCAFVSPDGEVHGVIQTADFAWPAGKRVERVSVRLAGQIRFFESGGVYHIRFLLDGAPLCQVPLPIFWDDAVPTAELAEEAS